MLASNMRLSLLAVFTISVVACSPSDEVVDQQNDELRGACAKLTQWTPDVTYETGAVVKYKGKRYECLQGHTALSVWQPDIVPALWAETASCRASGTSSSSSSGGVAPPTPPEPPPNATPDPGDGQAITSGKAGASVHYYFYKGYGMRRCPGRIAGYESQQACDALGRSQTENGPVNQVGLSCDPDPTGCVVGDKLMVTATDRCPDASKLVRVTYKGKTVTARIVDRTPGNGGFDLGLDPYIDLGIYADYQIGVTGPQEVSYECLK